VCARLFSDAARPLPQAGQTRPSGQVAQTEMPRSSSRLENSPGIRSEIVHLPLGTPSRPPHVAGREATIHHMGLPGTGQTM
jgi:hypothetical protein